MFGYAIFNINVTNPEDYKEYLQKVVPITEKFGGDRKSTRLNSSHV